MQSVFRWSPQEWEVDWANLVVGRTAEQTRRRWTLMLKHVPDALDKEFAERLSYLLGKFMPGSKEAADAAAAAAAAAAAESVPADATAVAQEPAPVYGAAGGGAATMQRLSAAGVPVALPAAAPAEAMAAAPAAGEVAALQHHLI